MERFGLYPPLLTTLGVMLALAPLVGSFPLETLEAPTATAERPPLANSSCHYKGVVYQQGEVLYIEEPCLSCTCLSSSLSCQPRVCPVLTDPLPRGCVVLHRTGACCPQLLCESEQNENQIEVRTERTLENRESDKGCMINGSRYAEGSAMASSSQCEFCYCISGRQSCVKPRCVMPVRGCKPSFREHACCPTHYDCHETDSRSSSRNSPVNGCELNGVSYPEGDMMPADDPAACQNCYCVHGQRRCVLVSCTGGMFRGCQPVHTPGQCCPSSYNCSSITTARESSPWSEDGRSYLKESNSTTEGKEPERTEIETTETERTDVTERTEMTEMTTEWSSTTEVQDAEGLTIMEVVSTTEVLEEGSETEREEMTTTDIPLDSSTVMETTTEAEDLTTMSDTTLTPPTTSGNPPTDTMERTRPAGNDSEVLQKNSVVEVMDVTLHSKVALSGNHTQGHTEEPLTNISHSEDEYDVYDDTELPPSLPNLVIFPFVAADAVVKEQQSAAPKSPVYKPSELKRAEPDRANIYKDYFSPPAETEGGFVPRDPVALGELSDPLFDAGYKNKPTGGILEEAVLVPPEPSITIPPKLKSEHCFSEGKEYRHGDLLSEAGDCISCVCFYGEVICQEATCPAVKSGCRRTAEMELNSCCGKVICESSTESPTMVIETVDVVDQPPRAVVAPVTIADTIDVTPDPFRDVIHTEPAPDLSSLMSDMLPFYPEQKKPVSVTYKNVVVDYYPEYLVTSSRDNEVKVTDKNPVYYSTEAQVTQEEANATTGVSPVFSHVTEEVTTSSEDPTTTTLRVSIRPVVLATTQPSRQVLTETTPTIERYRASTRVTTNRTKRPSLVSVRPKTSRKPTTTTESSFFNAFIEDLFNDKGVTATSSSETPTTLLPHVTPKFKYSAKLKRPKPEAKNKSSSSTPRTIDDSEIYHKLSEQEMKEAMGNNETFDDSFSLDSIMQMFFSAESTTVQPASTIRITTRPKHRNSTRKPSKKTQNRRTTRLPVATAATTVPPTTTTTTATETTTMSTTPSNSSTSYLQSRHGSTPVDNGELSFVTDQDTGFPRINILQQDAGPRKPTKIAQDLGGILKLAGCNIYGRMYRVGKIITELSGPCLECRCTDMGVQCEQLAC